MAMERGRGIELVLRVGSSLGSNFRGSSKNLRANPVLNGFHCEMRDEPQDLCLGKVKTQLSSLSKQMKRKIDVQLYLKIN